jgi:hypothetical protein
MPPNAQRGTGFINFQRWLGLNQNSADSMGNAMANDTDRLGQEARDEFTTGMENFNRDVRAGTPGLNGSTGEGTYTGPTSLDKYVNASSILGKGMEALTHGQAGATQEGRQALLQKKYGANTWGGSALDSALAGASSAGARLDTQGRDAPRGFAGLQAYLGGAPAAAAARVKKAEADTAANNQRWQDTNRQPTPSLTIDPEDRRPGRKDPADRNRYTYAP